MKSFPVCDLLGDYFEGVKQDSEKALKIYESNCSLHNYGHSCAKVATYKFNGLACKKDAVRNGLLPFSHAFF